MQDASTLVVNLLIVPQRSRSAYSSFNFAALFVFTFHARRIQTTIVVSNLVHTRLVQSGHVHQVLVSLFGLVVGA